MIYKAGDYMIQTYKNSKDGKVKVFFVVDDDNNIESVKVGNRVVPVESGYQYYVDKEVAEQIDKVTLDFSENKPRIVLKEGEEITIPEKTEKEKEIERLEMELERLREDEKEEDEED